MAPANAPTRTPTGDKQSVFQPVQSARILFLLVAHTSTQVSNLYGIFDRLALG